MRELNDVKESVVSDATGFSLLRERAKTTEFAVVLQPLNFASEFVDAPISRMEVNKHAGAEQDRVNSGIKQDIW